MKIIKTTHPVYGEAYAIVDDNENMISDDSAYFKDSIEEIITIFLYKDWSKSKITLSETASTGWEDIIIFEFKDVSDLKEKCPEYCI